MKSEEVPGAGPRGGGGFLAQKEFGFYFSATSLRRILSRGDALFNLNL